MSHYKAMIKPKKSSEELEAYINSKYEAANKYVETPELEELNMRLQEQQEVTQSLKAQADGKTGIIERALLTHKLGHTKKEVRKHVAVYKASIKKVTGESYQAEE
ncbi:hypothetical protein H0H81_001568 [Sphagnurus paluster]|uniref:Uncharacterized protein n=1 Tax=Sphagnurus paluster TaxID=117069 RepID=A0A9P7GMX9_9AGAR|nr:hypothetical protein H0H81_001568 [Sphagnurus paluster]